jgi:hypothetical protein
VHFAADQALTLGLALWQGRNVARLALETWWKMGLEWPKGGGLVLGSITTLPNLVRRITFPTERRHAI